MFTISSNGGVEVLYNGVPHFVLLALMLLQLAMV